MAEEIRDIAEQPPEQIRQQIDETRSALTEKLEALEETVSGTIQDARDTVQETIESARETVAETISTVKEKVEETVSTVKDTVQETVSTVKDTFNLSLQVERHPWPMMGGSFLTGLVTGAIIGERQHRRQMPMDELTSTGYPMTERREPDYRSNLASESSRPGLLDRFGPEIDKVKGLAIGFLFGLVRDVIKDNVPQYADKLGEVIDNITTKLGGQPHQGPVLPQQGQPEREHAFNRY